jgi:hypothetical protein
MDAVTIVTHAESRTQQLNRGGGAVRATRTEAHRASTGDIGGSDARSSSCIVSKPLAGFAFGNVVPWPCMLCMMLKLAGAYIRTYAGQ